MLKPEVALQCSWIPTIIAVIWLLTPPVLITLAIREWWKSPKKGPRTTIIRITDHRCSPSLIGLASFCYACSVYRRIWHSLPVNTFSGWFFCSQSR